MVVVQQEGKEIAVHRDDVEEVEPSPQSIMPEGIPKLLGPDRLRDLLTFLLVEPPSMPVYGEAAAAPAALDGTKYAPCWPGPQLMSKPVRCMSCSSRGRRITAPASTTIPPGKRVWRHLFEMDESVHVTTADPWPTPPTSNRPTCWSSTSKALGRRARPRHRSLPPPRRRARLHPLRRRRRHRRRRLRRAHRPGLAGRPLEVPPRPARRRVLAGSKHPIRATSIAFTFTTKAIGTCSATRSASNFLPPASKKTSRSRCSGRTSQNGGRVFVSIPGHFAWTFDDPAVPHAAAPRHRLDGRRAGRSLQRIGAHPAHACGSE